VVSFKAEMQTSGDPKFYSNALRFATEAEAKVYGRDLFNRWLAATDWRVAESDDPVNYAIIDNVLTRVEATG
jgi:hypothetical protein